MLLRLAVTAALFAGARAQCLLRTQQEACDNAYIPVGGGVPDPAICACYGAINFAGCSANEIAAFKTQENTLAAEADMCPNGGPIPWAANNGIPSAGDDDIFVDDDWGQPPTEYAYASGYAANSPNCYEDQAQSCEDQFGGATGAPPQKYCDCLAMINWCSCSLDYTQSMKAIMNRLAGPDCPNGIPWGPNNGCDAAPRCGAGALALAAAVAVAAALL